MTAHYLTNAIELQIKMAQGANRAGGHLPGHKVDDWLDVCAMPPGVGLISPPPHHDIYSIEDLAQLIYDLSGQPECTHQCQARLDRRRRHHCLRRGQGQSRTVLISGMDGGTGASPLSSIQHAGMPWELGIAEAPNPRSQPPARPHFGPSRRHDSHGTRPGHRVLGAEEWGVATAALIAEGAS